eukprot:PITA_28539
MQDIVPYTSQQNGVVEGKNHTLKEMANCMLQYKGLSLNFLVEVINCENYIVNRTLTKVLKNITREEAWSSIKPDSEDVKGYRLIALKSKNSIIRRDVRFSENISAYGTSLADVSPLSIPSTSKNISSSYDDSEAENPPSPSQDSPLAPQLPKWVYATWDAVSALVGDPIDQRYTRSQFDRESSLLAQASANYDRDTFAEASGLPDWDITMNEEYRYTFAEASRHLDWDIAMNEEYFSLLANDTWDLVPIRKG